MFGQRAVEAALRPHQDDHRPVVAGQRGQGHRLARPQVEGQDGQGLGQGAQRPQPGRKALVAGRGRPFGRAESGRGDLDQAPAQGAGHCPGHFEPLAAHHAPQDEQPRLAPGQQRGNVAQSLEEVVGQDEFFERRQIGRGV